jgi:hypothetical protein
MLPPVEPGRMSKVYVPSEMKKGLELIYRGFNRK